MLIATKLNSFDKFLFFILLLAFLHAVLRISYDSSLSLYRIFVPVVLLFFLFFYKKSLIPFIILVLLLIYNFLVSYFYCDCYKNYLRFSLHYISIFNVFIIIHYLMNKINFYQIYNFMYKFFLVIIFIAVLEIIFGFSLPNVGQYTDGSVSSFFWTQNEFTTAQLGLLPLILVLEKRLYIKVPLIGLILYMAYFINDSKIGFIGMVIAILVYSLGKVLQKNRYLSVLFLLLIILLVVVLSILPIGEININFRNDALTLSELLMEPINRIITLTPYEIDGGSIFGRTNAAIFGLMNLFDSYMFGIGIGNSYTMLTMSEYSVSSAESMHNLPLQLLVENGIVVLFLYLFLIYYFLKIFFEQRINDYKFIQLIAIPTFMIGSLSSSGGIFSNYYFITCLFIIILLNKNTLNNQTKLKELQ